MNQPHKYRGEVTPASMADDSTTTGRPRALIEINLPQGAARHPRLLDRVEERLDRLCLVDNRRTDLVVAVMLDSSTAEAAVEEASALAHDLLGFLALPEASLREVRVSGILTWCGTRPSIHLG